MELIEAMEAMDGCPSPTSAVIPTQHAHVDFFLQQIYYIHEKLKGQWVRQHRPVKPLRVPFAWVMSKTLRLLEQYPDGLTEAVVLTELMAQLHHRERLSLKRARVQTLEELLEENDEAVVPATVLNYSQHCITIQLGMGDISNCIEPVQPQARARMFVHQRLRSCMAALASLGSQVNEPFAAGRQLVFTNAKLLEKPQQKVAHPKPDAPAAVLLPTAYLALILAPQDRILHAQALSFGKMDVLASQDVHVSQQASSLLQELVVKARVVDISAIRPCTTPYHIQRQVIMLADEATSSQQQRQQHGAAVRSHVLILWDDQVALSRLFHVGDTLTLLHPFVHVCSPDDAEMVSVFEEYSSQQRCSYYLEYGTATTLFISPQKKPQGTAVDGREVSHKNEQQSAEHHRDVAVGAVGKIGIGFSVYAQVAKIHVSHGIPLLAAYFYSYYDPKTQGSQVSRPSLDRAVVSKYYLVVLVELYDAVSKQILSVELTGATALAALPLREGQCVYIEGLVSVDLHGDAVIQSLRDEKEQHKLLTQTQDDRVRFAFPNRAYASQIVALSSDWESLFGRQSDTFQASRLFVINEIPGMIKTRLPRDRATEETMATALVKRPGGDGDVAIMAARFTLARIGWMISEQMDAGVQMQPRQWTWDDTCERGFSTMLAHKACRRPLEMAASHDHTSAAAAALPRWKCSFCNEIFVGMEPTIQTYCDLLVRIDDCSVPNLHIHAICHGDAVSAVLGVPADSFSQLSLPNKRSVLRQAIGNEYNAILSRCLARQVATREPAGSSNHWTVTVDLRIDQLQPGDTFAATQSLLAQLQKRFR